ncbi:MAG TPA: OsmC family protein, partial [Sphingomicrobium sp.]|nr:OsmC family protein [Sphingomicrobium sp.]
GQFRSESRAGPITMGNGDKLQRDHVILADEPEEILGSNEAPNPQELLMAALNACMTVGYVAGAAKRNIRLTKLEIETRGKLDLRGFFALSDTVPPGYPELAYVVRIAGEATPEQFAEIHAEVQATSPNFDNLARAIRIDAKLEVEKK